MPFGLHRWFRSHRAAWWTLAAGLGATTVLGWQMHREAVAMDKQRLAMRVAEVTAQLDARLEKSEMLLQNLRDYLMLSGETRNLIFGRWCYENGLTINCPWILGIAVATNRFGVDLRSTLPQPPEAWTTNDWKALCRLAYQQPVECQLALRSMGSNGTSFLPDYDLRCDYHPNYHSFTRSRFEITILESRLGMSPQRDVMQGVTGDAVRGTLYYVPIYRRELAEVLAVPGLIRSQQLCARWLHLTSIIIAPVDFDILADSVWDGSAADLGIEMFSSTNNLTTETWLNISGPAPKAADQSFKPYLTYRQTWPMYGMKFSLFFYTTPLFEAQSPRRLAKVSMVAGTILTLLATALVGVAQRARSRQEVLTEQIREARDALSAAQQERNKISRDLHDGTIQSLYAIQLGLGHTVERIESQPVKSRQELSAVRRELDAVIAEIRQFVTTEAGAEKVVDFRAVLHALVQRARTGTTARIELDCRPGVSERLTGDQAVHLANITREALSNSLRHAKPQRVEISLQLDRETVVLEIADDGVGFEPQVPERTGVGLTSMAARAREMDGTLEIRSAPGNGTRVVVAIPASLAEPSVAEWMGHDTEDP